MTLYGSIYYVIRLHSQYRQYSLRSVHGVKYISILIWPFGVCCACGTVRCIPSVSGVAVVAKHQITSGRTNVAYTRLKPFLISSVFDSPSPRYEGCMLILCSRNKVKNVCFRILIYVCMVLPHGVLHEVNRERHPFSLWRMFPLSRTCCAQHRLCRTSAVSCCFARSITR